MKRNIFFPFLICAAILAGCKPDSNPSGNSEISTAANAPAEMAAPVDLPSKIAQAKTENKLLLLEFGSSDSCPPCIQFQQEVFSKPEFLDYEKSNVVFVRLDYPLKAKLPAAVLATNILIAQQFEAFAFPTFIALDADGKEFWRFPAKGDLNSVIDTNLYAPKKFIGLLESLKVKK